MMLVHASSTPSTMRVRSFSEKGQASRKPRTNLRIRARFPVWLENSTFFFIVRTKVEHSRVLLEVRNRKRVDSLRQAQFCPGMWRLPLILALTSASAFAQDQPTAYEALRVVGTQFNRAAIRRVLSVTGVDGDPQPATWKVMIADRNAPGGVREFEVAEWPDRFGSNPGAQCGRNDRRGDDRHLQIESGFERRVYRGELHRGQIAHEFFIRELHPADERPRRPGLDCHLAE